MFLKYIGAEYVVGISGEINLIKKEIKENLSVAVKKLNNVVVHIHKQYC